MPGSIDGQSGLAKTFRGKRIFITGHTGFKGSWLSIWLKELGAEVLGYSLEPPSVPSNFDVTGLSGKVIHTPGDIRNYPYLTKFFKAFKPEIVFHLAAQPIVRRSYDNPRETYETNVMGTIHMFEAIREASSVRAFINVTTDKCYENKEWLWGYRENDALGGNDPYSSSKACAELVSQAYIKSYFSLRSDTGIASVRAGNVIGGGDWGADRLLPDCFRALSAGNTILVRNPKAIRPWQFVLEPLYGYLLLASKLYEEPKEYMGAWNFGPRNECCVSVSEIVNKTINYWGSGNWAKPRGDLTINKHEMNLLKLNSDKAYSHLGWHGVLDIDSAVKMTVKWYKTFYQSPAIDMYDYCVAQIEEYMKKLSGT
jgi:CDP-glucose 4,6-dehydratase